MSAGVQHMPAEGRPHKPRQQFLREYGAVRASECRGSDDPRWYYALPWIDLTGRLASQWRMRGQSWRYFETRILPHYEHTAARPLRVLDLGAGNCWMSWRLALRGHSPVALDIFTDERDGLRASRHYRAQTPFPVLEAEFDRVPLASRSADLAIFNASLHYSSNFRRTLAEVLRVLRPGGAVVVIDSPVYRVPEHGRLMVAERRARFQREYGFPSDAQGSIEYLDEISLAHLAAELGIRWTIHKPWYGLSWHLRPVRAWLQRKRPPSRFWILVGESR
ncbi:MAG TPA: class I SAM-dependent methyltransferase [Bryobacteraceae bacterium]|nr:class I SAM-dependent methyltransferase [Bryobacteraceae bacterium]